MKPKIYLGYNGWWTVTIPLDDIVFNEEWRKAYFFVQQLNRRPDAILRREEIAHANKERFALMWANRREHYYET